MDIDTLFTSFLVSQSCDRHLRVFMSESFWDKGSFTIDTGFCLVICEVVTHTYF